MRTFRIHVREKAVMRTVWFVARVEVTRLDGWSTCGVFQLLQPEWDALERFCRDHEIEVEYEEPDAVRTDAMPTEAQ
jgi:hypothetical protein